MDARTETCMDTYEIDSFCGCIGEDESAEPAAKSFCKRAQTDKNLTGEDLAELKMALSDEDECCEC